MYEWYKKGITPNPDIMCNSEVKFKVFLDEALEHWFDWIAMWHYARIETSPQNSPLEKREHKQKNVAYFSLKWEGIQVLDFSLKQENKIFYYLKKWVDKNKDQSYFLAWLNQFQLSKAIFPIWDLEKSEVRKIALEAGLPNANRKDSQWICFVWKVDMSKFLEKKINPKPWIVRDTSWNILWTHKWVYYYTIWQRKWLDIWWQPEAIFVIKKNIEKNEIIVWNSSDLELYDDKLFVSEFHFLAKNNFEFPLKAMCKIRYRQEDQECIINKVKDWYLVEFKRKQRAIASGQICAVYVWNILIMSGIIN
jgi:tRNA-specific 2-thiouridylase